ncbi:MAG: hypothetical protein ACRDQ0_00045 [Pseudonocardia sp.]
MNRKSRITGTASQAANEQPTPTRAYFEFLTLDGGVYRLGEYAPAGTVTDDTGDNIPVVIEAYKTDGDWIDIQLSDGYVAGFPESRVIRAVTRTL